MSLLVAFTWPRMTADPVWPGVGESWYQPAGEPGSPEGVWTSPLACLPSGVRAASTPMVGTSTRTGMDAGNAASGTEGTGAAGVEPVAAGPAAVSGGGAGTGAADTLLVGPGVGGSACRPRP